jgi:hypothetical protein
MLSIDYPIGRYGKARHIHTQNPTESLHRILPLGRVETFVLRMNDKPRAGKFGNLFLLLPPEKNNADKL